MLYTIFIKFVLWVNAPGFVFWLEKHHLPKTQFDNSSVLSYRKFAGSARTLKQNRLEEDDCNIWVLNQSWKLGGLAWFLTIQTFLLVLSNVQNKCFFKAQYVTLLKYFFP